MVLALFSCKHSPEIIVDHPPHNEILDYGYYRNSDERMLVNSEIYEPPIEISSIELLYAIKEFDTLSIEELICVDSVRFSEAFKDIKVREMCLEMGIQGNTYFSAKMNKYGGFEEIKVVRDVDDCLTDIEEKIKQRVLTMRAISEKYGNFEIVFYHKLRIK
jgi:hypothetical protein